MPTIYKFGWAYLGLYAAYSPGETVEPALIATLDIVRFDYRVALRAVLPSALVGTLVLNRDWDPLAPVLPRP